MEKIRERTVTLWVKTAVVVSVALLLAVLVILLVRSCGSTVQVEEQSPGARYLARLEQSDCGAVTRFDSDVTLVQKASRLGLAIFGHPSENVFTLNAASSHVRLHWESATTLIVDCSGCETKDVHVWTSKWKEVSVKYLIRTPGDHPQR